MMLTCTAHDRAEKLSDQVFQTLRRYVSSPSSDTEAVRKVVNQNNSGFYTVYSIIISL